MFRPADLIQRARAGPRSPEPPAPETGTERPEDDDERLMLAAQRGDLDAFNQLVERHQRTIFNVCLRLLRDVAMAEDATQDTFIRAWSAVDRFRGGLVRPWLLRIATNRAYDLLRVRARRPTSSLEFELDEVESSWSSHATQSEPPEAFALRTELSTALEHALAALPEDQRLTIILADVHGFAYDEVAAITDVAIGTVKSRVSRGRARLREQLQRDPAGRELFGRLVRLTSEDDGE
ncbi:MAG: sigma-70 family RNA polymerase sigma factor [Chloroflexia bacterium]|nr:sigma-70 family RNA polymerase sigma factor [Chloroflexia bacterium]